MYYYDKTPYLAMLDTEEVAIVWPDVTIILPNIYALMGLSQHLAFAAYAFKFMPRNVMNLTLDELLKTPVPDVFRKAFEEDSDVG